MGDRDPPSGGSGVVLYRARSVVTSSIIHRLRSASALRKPRTNRRKRRSSRLSSVFAVSLKTFQSASRCVASAAVQPSLSLGRSNRRGAGGCSSLASVRSSSEKVRRSGVG